MAATTTATANSRAHPAGYCTESIRALQKLGSNIRCIALRPLRKLQLAKKLNAMNVKMEEMQSARELERMRRRMEEKDRTGTGIGSSCPRCPGVWGAGITI